MSGATGIAARRPIVSRVKEAVANPATAYLLRAAAWFVGLLGILRLPWAQTHLLLPYTSFQAGVAERLLGEKLRVVVAVNCSGSDAMAVCLGAILAFPVPWYRRLAAAAGGLAMITVVNTVRLAHLSRVVDDRELFDLLHRQIWPALIILVAAGYAFAWMRTATVPRDAARGSDGGLLSRFPAAPAVATGAMLVAAYYAFYDRLLASPFLAALAERTAWMAGTLMGACGVPATIRGGVLQTPGHAWIVTPECVTTPLVPIAVAAVLVARIPWRLRLVALLALPVVFQALAVARLMVLALPRFLTGSPTIAVHAFYQVLLAVALVVWLARRQGAGATRLAAVALAIGTATGLVAGGVDRWLVGPAIERLAGGAQPWHLGHGYVDPQGALAFLPAFQLGLLTALWIALRRRLDRREIALVGIAIVIGAGLTRIVLGELSTHAEIEVPVVAIRLWALLLPMVLAWPWEKGRRRAGATGSTRGTPSPAA